MKNKFKKGDKVVMFNCVEAKWVHNCGKVWTCTTDSFFREKGSDEKVFLYGRSGSISCKYLQLVKI